MNLYLLTQHDNSWYNTYDSAVVAAENMCDAKRIHPRKWKDMLDKSGSIDFDLDPKYYTDSFFGWTTPDNIQSTKIGVADPSVPRGVICASYNAG